MLINQNAWYEHKNKNNCLKFICSIQLLKVVDISSKTIIGIAEWAALK